MDLNTSIGLKIAKLRKEHGMTQEQLAENWTSQSSIVVQLNVVYLPYRWKN